MNLRGITDKFIIYAYSFRYYKYYATFPYKNSNICSVAIFLIINLIKGLFDA
jgi:hypothetical protein